MQGKNTQNTANAAMTQFEAGLSSMVNYLGAIASSNEQSYVALSGIYEQVSEINENLSGKNEDKKAGFLGKKFAYYFSTLGIIKTFATSSAKRNKILFGIKENLETTRVSLLESLKRIETALIDPAYAKSSGISFNKKPFVNAPTNEFDYLGRISNTVAAIYKYMTTSEKSDRRSTVDLKKINQNALFDFLGFSQGVKTLKENLSLELITNIEKLRDVIAKLLNDVNGKGEKVLLFFQRFSVTLKPFGDRADETANKIFKLTLALMFLQVFTAFNIFSVIRVIGVMVTVLILLFTAINFIPFTSIIKFSLAMWMLGNTLKKFASALIMFAIATILMGFVEWESVFKITVFIGLLGLAFQGASGNLIGGVKGGNSIFVTTSLIAFSIATAYLVTVLQGVGNINFANLMKIVGFVAALGLVITLFMKANNGFTINVNKNITRNVTGNKPSVPSGMLGLATGLLVMWVALMLLQDLQFDIVFRLIVFIASLGVVLLAFNKMTNSQNKKGKILNMGVGGSLPSGLPGFAFGLAIMVLAMAAMAELPWDAMVKTLVFIVALHSIILVFSLLNKGRGGNMPSGLPGFAFGLGLMVLAMAAMAELPWTVIGKSLVFLAALGLVMKLFNPKSNISFLALGVSMLVLVWSLKLFEKVNLGVDRYLELSLIIVGLAGLFSLIGKFFGKILIGSATVILMSISAMILGGTLLFINYVGNKISIANTLVFAMSAAILAGVFALLGIPAVAGFVLLGALTFALMSVSLLVGAAALWAINAVDIKIDNVIDFALSAGILGLAMAAFSLIAIPAAIGAVGFIVVSLAVLIGAAALFAIAETKIDVQNITDFAQSVKLIANAFWDNGLKIVGAVIPAALFIVISLSVILAAVALKQLSEIKLNPSAFLAFNMGLKVIVNSINRFGLIELGKTALKAAALTPIVLVVWLAAKAMKSLSETEIKPEKIKQISGLLNEFVNVVAETVSQNVEKLEKAGPGLASLGKMVSIAKDLADVVQSYSKLEFNQYEYRNGRLVVVGKRKLTNADFKAVGENVGLLVKSLIDPIAAIGDIGEEKEKIKIGSLSFDNPFSSTRVEKGSEIVAKIANAIKPLLETLDKFTSMELNKDPKMFDMFMKNLVYSSYTMLRILKDFDEVDLKKAPKNIVELTKFFDLILKMKDKKFDMVTTSVTNFLTHLSDDKKWKKIHSNIWLMKKQFKEMVSDINKINMDKALMFERNVSLLVKGNNAENLRETIKALHELLNTQFQVVSQAIPGLQQNNNNGLLNPINNTDKDGNKLIKNATGNVVAVDKNGKEITNSDKEIEILKEFMFNLKASLDAIAASTGGINNKLQAGTAIVQIKNNFGNNIQ